MAKKDKAELLDTDKPRPLDENTDKKTHATHDELIEKKSAPVTVKHEYKRPISHFLKIIVALFAVSAFALALNANYQTRQLNQIDQEKFIKELDALKQQQINMTTLTQSLRESNLNLGNKVNVLKKTINTALSERFYQKQDWLLLKARYYLELAQINAYWSDKTEISINILQQADAILQGLPLHTLFPIRQSIAKEITTLKTIPSIDIAGLLSKLDAAKALVAELPVNQLNFLSTSKQSLTAENKTTSTWQQNLQESLDYLQKLVVVKHYDADIQTVLSPLHQTLILESIRMYLQQAQWAVLQNNPQIYQQSLANAVKEIRRAYEKNSPASQSLIQQLQALQQINLNSKKPLIGNSLELLNKLIESNNSTGSASASTIGNESP